MCGKYSISYLDVSHAALYYCGPVTIDEATTGDPPQRRQVTQPADNIKLDYVGWVVVEL